MGECAAEMEGRSRSALKLHLGKFCIVSQCVLIVDRLNDRQTTEQETPKCKVCDDWLLFSWNRQGIGPGVGRLV